MLKLPFLGIRSAAIHPSFVCVLAGASGLLIKVCSSGKWIERCHALIALNNMSIYPTFARVG